MCISKVLKTTDLAPGCWSIHFNGLDELPVSLFSQDPESLEKELTEHWKTFCMENGIDDTCVDGIESLPDDESFRLKIEEERRDYVVITHNEGIRVNLIHATESESAICVRSLCYERIAAGTYSPVSFSMDGLCAVVKYADPHLDFKVFAIPTAELASVSVPDNILSAATEDTFAKESVGFTERRDLLRKNHSSEPAAVFQKHLSPSGKEEVV